MIRRKKILTWLAIGLAITMIKSRLGGERKLGLQNKKEILPPFIIIACKDEAKSVTSSFTRQLRQITVLLKSAVTFTSETLRFIVLTNSVDVFNQIKSIPSKWPDNYKSRLQFESGNVWYPSDREEMKNYFRPCSSARLFLPQSLRDIDAAVLVDTDTIFLRPPEDLLREIYRFNESQAVGMVQTSKGYVRKQIPFPKPNGANTGVMVMNLTRLRALREGWTNVTLKAFDKYRKRLSAFKTNDIVNIAVGQNPEIYYNLDCVWNYNTGSCIGSKNICPKAETSGVYLLHGTKGVFTRHRSIKFRSVFDAWENYQLGSSLSELLEDIKDKLKSKGRHQITCRKMPSLDIMFTKSLQIMLEK
ncbi:glucoside xylosyltransferase 1-like [Palaemon carinicauda]|uniref:glucoside xylosyltransferase 1-like n=1 Tax=Palaemon carinicauda TaxID=392227 RepID=UPI0035B57233